MICCKFWKKCIVNSISWNIAKFDFRIKKLLKIKNINSTEGSD